MLWSKIAGAGGLVGGGGGGPISLTNFSYSGSSVALTGASPLFGLDVANNGLSLLLTRYAASGSIRKYNLATAWDLATASGTASQNLTFGYSTGCCWSDDGMYVYATDFQNSRVYGIPLSTAWDLSTKGPQVQFSLAGQSTLPYDVNISPGGSRMYVRFNNGLTYQYTLSTPYNVTTAVYTGKLASLRTYQTFTEDGSQVLGCSSTDVNLYNLGTPWDISTAVLQGSLTLSGPFTTIRGVALGDADRKLYIFDQSINTVYQYNR